MRILLVHVLIEQQVKEIRHPRPVASTSSTVGQKGTQARVYRNASGLLVYLAWAVHLEHYMVSTTAAP